MKLINPRGDSLFEIHVSGITEPQVDQLLQTFADAVAAAGFSNSPDEELASLIVVRGRRFPRLNRPWVRRRLLARSALICMPSAVEDE